VDRDRAGPAAGIPTLKEMVEELAVLGGYPARNNDGPPGAQVIWRGLTKLHTAAIVYRHAISEARPKSRRL